MVPAHLDMEKRQFKNILKIQTVIQADVIKYDTRKKTRQRIIYIAHVPKKIAIYTIFVWDLSFLPINLEESFTGQSFYRKCIFDDP